MDLLYDVEKTRIEFNKHTYLSWSAFDNFQTCRGLWFINYFLKSPPEVIITPLEKENTRTLPGTIIQKVMEVFINERIYRRADMLTLSALLGWLQTNTRALYYLGTFPKDHQFLPDFIKTKTFWQNNYGKKHLLAVREKYGLDSCFSEINLSFVDKEKFAKIYGSEEDFINKINSLYPKVLQLFVDSEFDLDKMLSEVKIKVPLGNFVLSGVIDFIYNTYQQNSTFSSILDLKNGYFMFDGKYNISATTKSEQLLFYAFLIYLKFKKIPERLALLDWNKGAFKDVLLDDTYKAKVEATLYDMSIVGERIKNFLGNANKKVSNFFEDSFVELNPSANNCAFCLAKTVCPKSCINNEIYEKIQAKQEAKKTISELPDDSNTTDITL